jgi:lipopolysaccharide exporter
VNMGAVLFQKNLQFGRKLIYDFSYIVTEIIAVIIAAQFIPNVWALVIGALAGQCASLVFSYVFHGYRPRLTLNFSGARELFRFGKWISLAAIVTFFISKSDGIAISKFLGVEEFGYYQLAFSLALLPGFEIVRSLGSVFFPLFARLKENRIELQASFVRLARVVLLIVAPATVGLYVIAEPLVVQLYGERWLPMIPVFNVLILYGGLKSVEYFLTPLVLGTGNPRILTYGTGIHAAVLGVLIVPLTERYGVEGTAYSLVAAALVSTVYFGIRSYPIVAPTLGQSASIVVVPVLATLCMYVGMEIGIERFGNHVPLSIGMGVILYALGVAVFDLCTGKHIRTSLIWMKRTMYVR